MDLSRSNLFSAFAFQRSAIDAYFGGMASLSLNAGGSRSIPTPANVRRDRHRQPESAVKRLPAAAIDALFNTDLDLSSCHETVAGPCEILV